MINIGSVEHPLKFDGDKQQKHVSQQSTINNIKYPSSGANCDWSTPFITINQTINQGKAPTRGGTHGMSGVLFMLRNLQADYLFGDKKLQAKTEHTMYDKG